MPTFPNWYDPTNCWIDQEYLFKNYFAAMLPDTSVVSWLPPGDQVLTDVTDGMTYLRIFRVGGVLMADERGKSYVDAGRIQFAAIAKTRLESWRTIDFIRTVMWEYYEHEGRMSGGGITAMVKTIGEVEGPQLTPVQFRDERLVPVTFDVEVKRPKGLPNYRIALGL